jgi:uncharacterized protein (DUF58 family)
MSEPPEPPQAWHPSIALPAGAVVALLFLTAGLIFSRADLAIVALPILISVVVAWERRPRKTSGSITAELGGAEHGRSVEYRLGTNAEKELESVQLRVSILGEPSTDLLVSTRRTPAVTGDVPIIHSGPQEFVRASGRFIAADAAYVAEPTEPLIVRRVIASPRVAVQSLPLPALLHGITGAHISSRVGDGGDFRDIHPFAVGDRLRRIDWKATARLARGPGDLFVRRTTATADAMVAIVVDSRDDIGENVAAWQGASRAARGRSSMDVAREAASSLAASYIRAGDRVGFQDLASGARVVQHGGGSRHLERLLRAIELTAPSGPPVYRVRAPHVVSGSLIYLLSTFLDDEPVRLAQLWRGTGHRVIAVDVLPDGRTGRLPREEVTAHRIVMMERADRIRSVVRAGVDVLRWPESTDGGATGARAARLRTLSRPTRTSR